MSLLEYDGKTFSVCKAVKPQLAILFLVSDRGIGPLDMLASFSGYVRVRGTEDW